MRAWKLAPLAPLLVPATLAAQQTAQPRALVVTSRAEEIRLAKTAAPAEISKNAKIWVLDNGHYVVAEQGTSGIACMIGRSLPNTFEPACGDATADSTIMAIYRFRIEQRLAGKAQDETNAEVTKGLASGRFRLPQHPSLIYMESASQLLPDPSGKQRSQFYPHVMVYYPNMKSDAMGIVDSNNLNIPGVLDEGTPMAALIVIVRDWTESSTASR
jgi:hypothetical protein